MNVPDEYLKAAYRRYLGGLLPSSRKDCPLTADLIRFFSAGSTRRFKSRVLDHVAGCGFCADEFEILLDMDRDARAFSAKLERLRNEDGPAERRLLNRGFIAMGRWLFVGAGLAAVFAGILILATGRMRIPDDAETYRSGDSQTILLEHPRGPVDGNSALVFRWRPADRRPADAYVVSLFDDSLRQFWKSPPVESLTLILPREVQMTLGPHQKYFWMVAALAESGSAESDLELFIIEIRAPMP
ncbi:MAG: hypothetical protein NTW38_02225 [Candidatus Aminicenantes bacterium]|nr:hypothetical protein [Candidatus Aminicenantes bacterium]